MRKLIQSVKCWFGWHDYDEPVRRSTAWFRGCPHCMNSLQVLIRGRHDVTWQEVEVGKDCAGRFFVRGTNGNRISMPLIMEEEK